MPQAATSAAPSPSPSVSPIPWNTKIDALQEYILQQPDQNATKGWGYGPSLRLNYADGDCLEVRFYNWNCLYDIPFKMRQVAKFLDDANVRNNPLLPGMDRYRWWVSRGYVDPDNGWDFYGDGSTTFGACGHRGPMSACGMNWCVNKEGTSIGSVYPLPPIPDGFSPYLDPNNRNNTCPWLKGNETTTWRV